ncbi:O-antigen ligase family protein [Paenibacillus sp. sptzw28]|uniref:O-antigen ligase family protein n=1 Tax=Paenibacillus sp. sptzw28 TaxID=715179 RepID=UPI001C6E785E|nr:O-antigen ligase family protein [Paenibacillus sp. sptzw28]QYR19213.1 O-antigen ligase family protein [Paenibacillus sp. sptzw28]
MELSSSKSKILFVLFASIIVSFITLTGLSNTMQIIFALALLGIILYLIQNQKLFWYFVILIPFLPPYFSYKMGEMPFINGFRILLFILIYDQLILKQRISNLVNAIKGDKFKIAILIYATCILIPAFVRMYSMQDASNLVSSITIIVEKVLLYYLILMNIHIEVEKIGDKQKFLHKFLHTISIVAFILSVFGVIEFLAQFNIFSLLDVSNFEGLKYSQFIRSGHLRVSSSFAHSLGYSMYLIIMIPLIFYQIKMAKEISKKQYYFYLTLLVLLMLNMFMTLSRSALISLSISLIVFFIFAKLKTKIRFIFLFIYFALPLLTLSVTPFGESIGLSAIGDSVKALSDSLFGTSYVKDFGNNVEPFSFREELIKYAFSQSGLEDFFGKGIGFLRNEPMVFYIPELNPFDVTTSQSVDSYYMLVKLEQGWVGLIATITLFSIIILMMLRYMKYNLFNFVLLLSFVGYLFELTMVADLDTIKYFWILLAVFSAYHNFKEIQTNNPPVICRNERRFAAKETISEKEFTIPETENLRKEESESELVHV